MMDDVELKSRTFYSRAFGQIVKEGKFPTIDVFIFFDV
jgi:hypothetical protein